MIDQVLQLDTTLFHWVNNGLTNAVFDWLMPILRNKYTWLPFYVFILVFSLINLKWQGAWLVLCLALSVSVADTLSSKVIKHRVERLRPCNQQEIREQMTLRVDCGSGYSFTSSHATNHFAVGMFLFVAFGQLIGRWKWLLLVWAGSIAFAQVYVGVHFPFDILVGGLLGILLGYLFGRYYLSKVKRWFLPAEKEVDVA